MRSVLSPTFPRKTKWAYRLPARRASLGLGRPSRSTGAQNLPFGDGLAARIPSGQLSIQKTYKPMAATNSAEPLPVRRSCAISANLNPPNGCCSRLPHPKICPNQLNHQALTPQSCSRLQHSLTTLFLKELSKGKRPIGPLLPQPLTVPNLAPLRGASIWWSAFH